jgi:hypothetical protein
VGSSSGISGSGSGSGVGSSGSGLTGFSKATILASKSAIFSKSYEIVISVVVSLYI